MIIFLIFLVIFSGIEGFYNHKNKDKYIHTWLGAAKFDLKPASRLTVKKKERNTSYGIEILKKNT